MNSQENTNFFKQKRDEYLVEIRKKKVSDKLQSKRYKLAMATEHSKPDQNSDQPPIPLNELASAFIDHFKRGDLVALQTTATAIRKAVSIDDNPPIEELISTGVVRFILELIQKDYDQPIELVIECLWITANIASHKPESVKYIVDHDIIPIALDFLSNPNQDVKENAIWILSNIAAESKLYKATLFKKGIATKIDALLSDHTLTVSIITQAAWLMSNLCKAKPCPEFGEIASFLHYIQFYIKNYKEDELLEHCMATLCSLTDIDDEDQIAEIFNMDILDEMLTMLKERGTNIKGPIVKTLGNIICNSENHVDDIVEKGIIEALFPLLDEPDKQLRKDTCWTYANLIASDPEQISNIFRFGNGKVIEKLFNMAIHDHQKEVAEQCLYALTNACDTGSAEEINALVELGLIELIVEIFKTGNNKELIEACLGALNSILNEGKEIGGDVLEDNPYYVKLQECEGITVLEKLQNFANNDMFKVIEEILDNFSEKSYLYN